MAKSREALDRKAQWNRELRAYYREKGICNVCGSMWVEPGYTRCKNCIMKAKARQKRLDPDGEKHKAYVKRLRAERKAKGLCVECGKRPPKAGRVRCQTCIDKNLASTEIYRIRQRIKLENARQGKTGQGE